MGYSVIHKAKLLLVKLQAAIALITVCALCASAQSNARVEGTVMDADKAIIEGASVKLINLATSQVTLAKTDSSGHYEIDKLQAGSYRLSVGSPGFATLARTVTLKANSQTAQDFTLVPGAITDVITVTASKGNARASADTAQPVTVATSEEIERIRPESALEALQKTPSLTVIGSNPVAERPRLRGLSANRVLLVIDGERLNNFRSDPISGISPSVVDVTQLESAEVVAGANSSLYGSDALAGTINLVTRAPARAITNQLLAARLDGDLHTNGLFRRASASVNWSIPRVALRLGGSLFSSSNYHAGNSSVSVEEVVRLGRLAVDMGNASGNNVARTYTVWSLPENAEIANSRARGFNDQLDLWFFPTESQSIRFRQLNSQHKGIGYPFVVPPFDTREQSNGFRRLDKYSLRYERRELGKRLAHIAGGLYRQKYSFADDNFVSAINEGSSWQLIQSPEAAESFLTGNPSTFTLANFTDGKNSVTSLGVDAQATLIPRAGAVITTGINYLRDYSKDQFLRIDFEPGSSVPRNTITGRAANPDSVYRNLGWFSLVEYEPAKRVRLIGGLRVDNWKTEARVTSGFPLGTEAAILDASLNQLIANPGQINVAGIEGIGDLLGGTRSLGTNNTIATGNVGVIIRLPGRINPYFRWATSYREPGITERYILRDFGDPTFSVLLGANTRLQAERGRSYDAGVKVQRDRWSGSFAYFRNDFRDFLKPSFSGVLFVPADPRRGLEPLSPQFPFHGVLYVQRTNTARARIQGIEADFELSISLGSAGAITPFGSIGWMKGSDLTPDQTALALINQFYNRADTPVQLEGSATDAPLSAITRLKAVTGARYTSRAGRWFGEYEVRAGSRVTRVDPLDLSATISTQYGTLASLSPFTRQAIRAGYSVQKEDYRVSYTLGVENLTDRFYFEQFQNAPARGRSVVFGLTLDFGNLLSR